MIGPGLAWIAPLKITDINSCMAAIQPDTSTCLGSEQSAIRTEKTPERLVSLLSLNPISFFFFFFFVGFVFGPEGLALQQSFFSSALSP